MYVKAYKNGVERVFQCTHIEVTDLNFAARLKDSDGRSLTGGRTGLDIQLCGPDVNGIVINLPTDADVVYTTNDRGDTLHKYQWPPKKVAAGAR